MRRVAMFIQRYGLGFVLLVTVASSALAAYAVIRVQSQRKTTILAECRDQNARHTATIYELNKQIARFSRGASKTKRAQLAASRSFTVLLIDQLAPYQNCWHLAGEATSVK